MTTVKNILVVLLLSLAGMASAQTAILRGGSLALRSGAYGVTLTPPASFYTNGASGATADYTMTFASAQSTASLTMWISNDGAGNLGWNATPNGLSGNAVSFVPGLPQQTATSGNFLFNLANRNVNSNTDAPGAFVASSVVDQSGSSATGLTLVASNTSLSATGVTIIGLNLCAFGLATGGTNVGIRAGAFGGGSNYAALFTAGSVGISTSAPTELLEVNGNIRISGKNGLKITEGSNGTMGVATLGVGGNIVVSTTKVTANSRIFLMGQAPNAGTPGTVYINARTAGTSFTIQSTNAADRSDVAWWIVEP